MSANPDPVADAATLRAFVDVLLPGDDLFPSASAAGAHGLLAERLRQRQGPEAIARLVALLAAAAGGRFADLERDERVDAVRRLERDEPVLFDAARTILYYSYYQSPLVARAVRALGFDYNDAPQPLGYAMTPFDPTPGHDAPATPRGSYKRTTEITWLDLSGIGGRSLAREAKEGS